MIKEFRNWQGVIQINGQRTNLKPEDVVVYINGIATRNVAWASVDQGQAWIYFSDEQNGKERVITQPIAGRAPYFTRAGAIRIEANDEQQLQRDLAKAGM